MFVVSVFIAIKS